MFSKGIPITILTDSESLLKIMVKSTTTTKKRLIIDIRAAKEAFKNSEISSIGRIRSEENAADGLTKQKKCDAQESIMESGYS